MENITLQEKKDAFKKRLEAIDVASLNDHDRAQYECNLKHYNVYINQLEYAEKKGREEGKEEGRKKGREEGREEARKKWREEEKFHMAGALKLEGVLPSIISKCTGLTIEQIEEL